MDTVSLVRYVNLCLMVLACLTAFIALRKLRQTFWQVFPFYLLFVLCMELLAYYFLDNERLEKYSPILFNYVVRPPEILFFYWLLWRNIRTLYPLKSNWLWAAAIVYLGCWLIDCRWVPRVDYWIFTFSYAVGVLLLLSFILLFFYHYMNSVRILNFKSDMAFWVCLGLCFYYTFALPFEGFRNTLLGHEELFMKCWYLNIALNCLMYVTFITSFLWTKPK